MSKKLLALVALFSIGALVACHKENDYRPYEDGEAKNKKGFGTIFDEVIGYNTKDAAVIQEGEERYVVYASNEIAQGKQVFAARKATLVDGKWQYGAKNIVLRGNESSWDKNIYNPSIIKGNFSYQGTTYNYLMAYNGNANGDVNNHIGLAVTNDILSEYNQLPQLYIHY